MTQRFTVKKKLTEMVNMAGWVIYRDSVYGMYAVNNEMGIEIPLMRWNITLNDPKLKNIVESIRTELAETAKGWFLQ